MCLMYRATILKLSKVNVVYVESKSILYQKMIWGGCATGMQKLLESALWALVIKQHHRHHKGFAV